MDVFTVRLYSNSSRLLSGRFMIFSTFDFHLNKLCYWCCCGVAVVEHAVEERNNTWLLGNEKREKIYLVCNNVQGREIETETPSSIPSNEIVHFSILFHLISFQNLSILRPGTAQGEKT